MTKRAMAFVLPLVAAMAAVLPAQQRGGRGTTPAKPPAASASTTVIRKAGCVSALGKGVKKEIDFCDVIIAPTGEESVSIELPAHTGPATLLFDLHPRFEVPSGDSDAGKAFQRHTAVVAIVGPTGDVIDLRAAVGEFRGIASLFDRLPGDKPGSFKVVAPGMPTPVKVTIPAGTNGPIGIVGVRVEIMNRFNQLAYSEPRIPVAIVSNWQIQYTPR